MLSALSNGLSLGMGQPFNNQALFQDTRGGGSQANGAAVLGTRTGGSSSSGPGYPLPPAAGPTLQGQLLAFRTPSAVFLTPSTPQTVTDAPALGLVPTLLSTTPATTTAAQNPAPVLLGLGETLATNRNPTVSAASVATVPANPASTVELQPVDSRSVSTAVPSYSLSPIQGPARNGPADPVGQNTAILASLSAQGLHRDSTLLVSGLRADPFLTVKPASLETTATQPSFETRQTSSLFLASVGGDSAEASSVRLPREEAPVAGMPIPATAAWVSEQQLAETLTEGVAPGLAQWVNGSSSAQEQTVSAADAVWTTWSTSSVARMASLGLLVGYWFASNAVPRQQERKQTRLPQPE